MSAITPDFVKTMAAYNAEMNRRLYESAGRLPEAARRQDRRAFWGSIHGTLNHLLWGDRIWMSRFDGWEKPQVTHKDSASLIEDFQELRAARVETDMRLTEWAGRVRPDWLGEDMTTYSQAAQREITKPRDLLVMHFFNHQTHHRGQVHAMLTAAGEKTGDTDLPLVLAGLAA